ncbi:hypothetical protein ANN_20353 [Periplaneta americana]|uniref:Uncharacterized protein n=1 Tax=Periplaneta americana TaxID=6978 RepID=A0ABQ8SCP0_PERAM|nr:hypothetical protein ANN_20353 [Periplaneta americana]
MTLGACRVRDWDRSEGGEIACLQFETDEQTWHNQCGSYRNERETVSALILYWKKEHLLRTSGERTNEETSEVLCVECGIVWEQKHGHYDEVKRSE